MIPLIKNKKRGFTLVEVLVGTAIFLVLALSVYQTYLVTMNVIRVSRQKITATALANEQFEIIRNLPYNDVGIIGGLPLGKIPVSQNLFRDGIEFTVDTTIRNIDDAFDGTIGGEPNDSSPADYKLVEVKITCATCSNFPPLYLSTYIAPKNLESSSTNGALFIKVFDANGQPIPGVNVQCENNQHFPPFIIADTTNNDGLLQIVDAPPGIEAYEITVSKPGYTNEQTYPSGEQSNPNPNKPHATVLIQQLTQISFTIDKVSTLEVSSIDNACLNIPNINFSLEGLKLIGTDPNIYKYTEDYSTDDSGTETVTNLEWDTYNLNFLNDFYDLAGVVPATNFILGPDVTQNLKLIVIPKNPKSLLVTVRDASTSFPLSDAEVRLTGIDYDTSLQTGRGFLRQTDWSQGAGQENYVDQTKYYDSDGNVTVNDPAGVIELKNTLGGYASNAWLISSTFDTGTESDFHQIQWQPQSQVPETGNDSVRLQIATNNDKASWNFYGPDGTTNTYYTSANQNINSNHNGDRYLRYKVFLQTTDTSKTPTISDISFTFTSACVPPGQVFFTGLLDNNYNMTITKDNYNTYSETVITQNSWQQSTITLNP